METIKAISHLFDRYGKDHYGESVSQVQHAVQAAKLAQAEDASIECVVAAFLHDIGHLLVNEVPENERENAALRHQQVGADYLGKHDFSPLVCEMVLKHVDAKRYLTATDDKYHASLSSASVESLAFQGGPMSAAEIMAFDQLPNRDLFIRIRQWDEAAKDQSDKDTNIQPYLTLVEAHLASRKN